MAQDGQATPGDPQQLLLGHGSPSWLETRSVNHLRQFQNRRAKNNQRPRFRAGPA
jgi:hypothetical protein